MGWQGWVTLASTTVMLGLMAWRVAPIDTILLGCLAIFLALGILPLAGLVESFANEAMLTVAALLIVAAAVKETGGLDLVARRLFGRPKSVAVAQARMMVPACAVSAFLNNTPIVAVMVPIVSDWARRIGVNNSKLLIPLTYAVRLGGACTLIGTSTNLVVVGVALARDPSLHFAIFDLAPLGIPGAIAGMLFIIVASKRLLPDRSVRWDVLDNPREYTVAMRIEPSSPIVGQTIEEAGLRHLPGLFLIEIQREGEVSVAVGPRATLRANDTLVFAGLVDSVLDLRKIRGVVPATDQVRKLLEPTRERKLLEAVVAVNSRLTGQTVRETGFRTNYAAAIIAVHRRGERIRAKIGDIMLQPGDTLLLEAHPSFLHRHRNDANFALVSEVDGSSPPNHDRAWISLVVLVALVVVNVTGWMPLLTASLLAVGGLLITRCLTLTQARGAVDGPVLLTIAAGVGVGSALEATGAAAWLANGAISIAQPFGPMGALAGVFFGTSLLTAVVSCKAAVVLMFPVVYQVAVQMGLPLAPTILVLMVAGSASFATPTGHPTNILVMGAGGYRFADFVRLGAPLTLVVGATTMAVAHWLWL